MTMRLALISFHSCPFSLLGGDGAGGMSVYLRELASAMTKTFDLEIDIFTRLQWPQIRGIKKVLPKVRVIHLKAGPEKPFDRRLLFELLPEFSENLEDFIFQEDKKYDLIYSHYWLSGIVGEKLKPVLRVPHVHMYHTMAFLKRRILADNKEHEKRLEAEEQLAHSCDAVISSSRQERKNLIKFFDLSPQKVHVIYPGVNARLFYPCPSQEVYKETNWQPQDKILLYVGRIEPVKGLMTIIETLAWLKAENKPLYDQLKLAVVGGGRKERELSSNKEVIKIKQFLRRKNMRGRVFFLGSKKQNDLKKYYSTAEALIVPSLYESFGLVVIEALACGTPVLVSQIGEMRNIIREGKNGFSFLPNNPLSLGQCLQCFFTEKQNLWSSEKISQKVKERFSWLKTGEETYRILKDLLAASQPATTISLPDEKLQPA
ncbi:MAG: glycosyltransferase [Candidatus Aminicenantales bacterium]